jgi:hypothetical protein
MVKPTFALKSRLNKRSIKNLINIIEEIDRNKIKYADKLFLLKKEYEGEYINIKCFKKKLDVKTKFKVKLNTETLLFKKYSGALLKKRDINSKLIILLTNNEIMHKLKISQSAQSIVWTIGFNVKLS